MADRRAGAAVGRGEGGAPETKFLTIRRVRVRSLVRLGFRLTWIASAVPAVLAAIVLTWALHGIWATLDGWQPWTPWSPDARILGAPLPQPPEFRPREALRLNGLYRALEPIGRHPFLGGAALAVALTLLGQAGSLIGRALAGLAFNRFARLIGGIEFEVIERPARRPAGRPAGPRARRGDPPPPGEWDEAELRW